MKRKIKNKLLFLAMSMIIIVSLSLSACNSSNTSNDSQSQNKQTTEQNSTKNSEIKFAGGSGTVEDPYQIASAEQFEMIKNNLSANYILTKDIDFSSYDNLEKIGEFNPLSDKEEDAETPDSKTAFNGSFDGDNHVISNITIKDAKSTGVGLFACISNKASMKNLTVKNITVEGGNWTGGVIGLADSGATIENIILEGDNHISGTFLLGGIVGASHTNIKNCAATANVTLKNDNVQSAGVIVGGLEGGNIEDCHVKGGTVEATGNLSYGLGGLAGCVFQSEYAKNCSVEDVTIIVGTKCELIGGLAGFSGTTEGEATKLVDCTVKSITIKSDEDTQLIGGIVGGGFYRQEYVEYYKEPTAIEVSNCTVEDVNIEEGNVVGSVIGYSYDNSSVKSCESSAKLKDKDCEAEIGGDKSTVILDKLY